jgi:dihydroorotase
MPATSLTIPRPDDWHVHLRDGELLKLVVRDSAASFGRAIVMPNLTPPITTARAAAAYRERIRAVLPSHSSFEPLMTCYLTNRTDADDLIAGAKAGIFVAAKLYPAGATTNSSAGVTDIRALDAVFEAMADADLPLLLHGEVVDGAVDVFDREAVFIERVLAPLRQRHANLRIVFEHITTADAVNYVLSADAARLAATITPHHLSLNRNAMFRGGMCPHMYCLPIVKRERHREALCAAACSGDAHFFLGTDSAPHARAAKESACGCAGIYNSPSALATYLEIFEQADALDKFAAFAAENGPRFYRLPINSRRATFVKGTSASVPVSRENDHDIETFEPPFALHWRQVATQ